jgi:anthranilate 1,2-dioxygenase small subunit
MSAPAFDTDLALTARVAAFLHDYAAGLDEERWAEWPAHFVSDGCRYEVLSRENVDLGLPAPIMGCYTHGMVRDRVAMLIKDALTFRRMYLLRQVTNVRAARRPDDAALVDARANLVVYQSDPEGVSSLYMVARYRAELVESAGRFRIRGMAVVVDSFGIDTMLAVPL